MPSAPSLRKPSLEIEQLVHWLLASLKLDASVFHVGQYCGDFRASTTGHAFCGSCSCWRRSSVSTLGSATTSSLAAILAYSELMAAILIVGALGFSLDAGARRLCERGLF